MRMQHHFTVPVPADVAWRALLDPERVAPCMPGATLTESGEDGFAGSVKVKLGPVTLNYRGKGGFTEIDEDDRRVVIDAGGKDARGNGTASATVTAVLSERSAGGDVATDVQVDTDLKVTGKPAQFGRGLISDVGDRILGQFAECLAQRLAAGSSGEEGSAEAEAPADSPGAAEGAGAAEEAGAAEGADTGAAAGPEPAATTGPVPRDQPAGAELNGSAGRAAGGGRRRVAALGRAPGWRVTPPKPNADRPDADAVDLLGAAGAPVLKRVLPVVGALAAVVGAVLLVRRLRRR